MGTTITLTASAAYGTGGKQFVARITGRDAKYTFAREFIGRKSGKRGETTQVEVDEPGLYEERDIDRKGNVSDTLYVVWRDGAELRKNVLDREVAMAAAKSGEDPNVLGRREEIAIRRKMIEANQILAGEEIVEMSPWMSHVMGRSSATRSEYVAACRSELARLTGESPAPAAIAQIDRGALAAEAATLRARLAEIELALAAVSQ